MDWKLISTLLESLHSIVENRPSCLDCIRKHLAQASALMDEARQGHPQHRWLAIGHLGEAEAESLGAYPDLAKAIRKERLLYMENPDHDVPIMELIDQASEMAEED